MWLFGRPVLYILTNGTRNARQKRAAGQPTKLKVPSHSARLTQGGTSVSNSRMFMLLLFVVLVFGTVETAKAQGGDVYFNIGTAQDKSNNQLIDTFGDGNLFPTPAMNGAFGCFGGTFMFRPTIGIGAEYFAPFSQR